MVGVFMALDFFLVMQDITREKRTQRVMLVISAKAGYPRQKTVFFFLSLFSISALRATAARRLRNPVGVQAAASAEGRCVHRPARTVRGECAASFRARLGLFGWVVSGHQHSLTLAVHEPSHRYRANEYSRVQSVGMYFVIDEKVPLDRRKRIIVHHLGSDPVRAAIPSDGSHDGAQRLVGGVDYVTLRGVVPVDRTDRDGGFGS
jgi:hypothetical protein